MSYQPTGAIRMRMHKGGNDEFQFRTTAKRKDHLVCRVENLFQIFNLHVTCRVGSVIGVRGCSQAEGAEGKSVFHLGLEITDRVIETYGSAIDLRAQMVR